MICQVKKRNEKTVEFDPGKIASAIERAGFATGEFDKATAKDLAAEVTQYIDEAATDSTTLSVEEIQDHVEYVLLRSPYRKTAKAYILYRDQHRSARELAQVATVDLVDAYLDKSDWKVNENSNMSYSLQGLNNHLSSELSKTYWLDKIYPREVKEAHSSGLIHLHDLNLLSVYCVGWDLSDLLQEGFRGVHGKVESKPAKHLRSALGQIVNFFYTLQGEAAGAQAFSNVDTLLAPYIYYDELSYDEVKQAMQEFLFNVNVPTRVGFQAPFTNITLDLCPPKHLSDTPVIIGGKQMNKTYGEFQNEMNMFNRAFLELMGEGDSKGRVFTFPIPTYNISEEFDWDNKDLDALWDATAKYGLPYFSNFVNSDMNPEDARSMCCRLRIDNRQLEQRGGGLFGANPLTGSVGVVTINLPQIGLRSSDEDSFLETLRYAMELSKESLEIKRKTLERFTNDNLYPYTKFYLRNIKQRFDCYWKNHFSTIGLIGMNEAVKNLFGPSIDLGSARGVEFAERVLDEMRSVLLQFQAETSNNYNLEATPAEGTTYRLASIDQKNYPSAQFANGIGAQVAHPFYTNSTHLPVDYTDDIFELLDKQDSLQTKYTGGTVVHLFIGEKISSGEVVKNLVRTVCNNYKLPYFTITPTFSVCPEHGYESGEHVQCTQCGCETEVYSRVVGYLRPVSQWNSAKQDEFDMRNSLHLIDLDLTEHDSKLSENVTV